MNLSDLLDDIQALDEELRGYERKYGVLTETFAEAYAAGEEPADASWVPDWTAWASAYDLWRHRRQQYQSALASFRQHGHSAAQMIERAARHESIPDKHLPPNIKHNRQPAPAISFSQPNLTILVAEAAAD